jgi:hypothetical protein
VLGEPNHYLEGELVISILSQHWISVSLYLRFLLVTIIDNGLNGLLTYERLTLVSRE